MKKKIAKIITTLSLMTMLSVVAASAATLQDFGYNNMTVNGKSARGQRPLLVILIDFSYNQPLAWSNAQADSLIFPVNGRTLNRYFVEASNDRFRWSRP